MDEAKIKACPFCGEPAGVKIETVKEKEYYAIGCKNLACRGSAWAADPDAVRALARWNERAGDRKSDASKMTVVSTLASVSGCAAALERAITALTYRADTLEESVTKRPGAAIASIMAEGVKNDRKAIVTLTEMLRHNDDYQTGSHITKPNHKS